MKHRTSEDRRLGGELRLTLTVPYVHHDVLVVVGRRCSRGVAYDPLSTRAPVPWRGDCPECREGRFEAPLKVRRAVQAMCTARLVRPSRYDVQVVVGRNAKCRLSASLVSNEWVVKVGTRSQSPRSPVLRRTSAMLASARSAAGTQLWLDHALSGAESPHPHLPRT
jgi:hypothetical protein